MYFICDVYMLRWDEYFLVSCLLYDQWWVVNANLRFLHFNTFIFIFNDKNNIILGLLRQKLYFKMLHKT